MQLNLNIVGIGQVELCVNEYPVAGFQFHISVWNQGLVSAFYQNDDGLAGNVQIPDAKTGPRIMSLQYNFL